MTPSIWKINADEHSEKSTVPDSLCVVNLSPEGVVLYFGYICSFARSSDDYLSCRGEEDPLGNQQSKFQAKV